MPDFVDALFDAIGPVDRAAAQFGRSDLPVTAFPDFLFKRGSIRSSMGIQSNPYELFVRLFVLTNHGPEFTRVASSDLAGDDREKGKAKTITYQLGFENRLMKLSMKPL